MSILFWIQKFKKYSHDGTTTFFTHAIYLIKKYDWIFTLCFNNTGQFFYIRQTPIIVTGKNPFIGLLQ